ncbi:MAG TPA: response regulator [Steroidobacteraceae bacterium]|nr:response regulator [Steroidobacteraceae bacterium]
MEQRAKPQILCVDDEPRVVDGLQLALRKEYEVHTASTVEVALQKLREVKDLAVVISDMRMPGMDGAAFLHQALVRRPDVTRILLTGQADRDEAIRAVNQGQIFRLLTKPCPPEELKPAIEAGVVQNRLLNAERAVLQETLLGCIKALMEVLAVANPVAFGRASGIKRRAMTLAARLGTPDFWQLEAAAMLSQLGYAALPPALLEKVYHARKLTPEEQAKVDAVPDMANKLLEHIPRLDPVIQILAALKWTDAQVAALGDGMIGYATRILCLILEYDALRARGMTHEAVRDQLGARTARFGAKLLGQLDVFVSEGMGEESVATPLGQLRPGMVLLEELRTATGALLVPAGFEVTRTFLDRIANIAPDLLEVPVRARAPDAAAKAPGKS